MLRDINTYQLVILVRQSRHLAGDEITSDPQTIKRKTAYHTEGAIDRDWNSLRVCELHKAI